MLRLHSGSSWLSWHGVLFYFLISTAMLIAGMGSADRMHPEWSLLTFPWWGGVGLMLIDWLWLLLMPKEYANVVHAPQAVAFVVTYAIHFLAMLGW